MEDLVYFISGLINGSDHRNVSENTPHWLRSGLQSAIESTEINPDDPELAQIVAECQAWKSGSPSLNITDFEDMVGTTHLQNFCYKAEKAMFR